MEDKNLYPCFHRGIPYLNRNGNITSLNTIDVCLPRAATRQDSQRLWIIYLHGGAWRDPAISSASFDPALSLLLRSSQISQIAGFASINYRLSSYPGHPEDPSKGDDPSRNAVHPDHIHDVLEALRFLQDTYHFKEQYMLVGHSCGATLAYQVIMDAWGSQGHTSPPMPCCVVGVAGIYDFTGLQHRHLDMPIYRDFLQNAFGTDWDYASPVHWLTNIGSLRQTWPQGRLAIVAHSKDDGLVEPEQAQDMLKALTESRNASLTRRDELISLKGTHDEIWSNGTELAAVILKALDRLT